MPGVAFLDPLYFGTSLFTDTTHYHPWFSAGAYGKGGQSFCSWASTLALVAMWVRLTQRAALGPSACTSKAMLFQL